MNNDTIAPAGQVKAEVQSQPSAPVYAHPEAIGAVCIFMYKTGINLIGVLKKEVGEILNVEHPRQIQIALQPIPDGQGRKAIRTAIMDINMLQNGVKLAEMNIWVGDLLIPPYAATPNVAASYAENITGIKIAPANDLLLKV